MRGSCHIQGVDIGGKYRSCALKSRSKLKATTGLRAALDNSLLYQNSTLFTVTFWEEVLTLAKNRGT